MQKNSNATRSLVQTL